jgi:leucyl/phenylalanyl-tRNA--protein transferase
MLRRFAMLMPPDYKVGVRRLGVRCLDDLVPVEPPVNAWDFPDPRPIDSDLIARGADLAPGTLLAAYRRGLFPMRVDTREQSMGWWSPVARGVLPLTGLHVSRSLRQARKNFEIRVDSAFGDVLAGCADPARSGSWIDPDIAEAYLGLHELGWAHSVEAWQGGRLVGGLYGVAVGGLFAGESMFHRVTDASKVALVALVELLRDDGAEGSGRLLDVQWQTRHLASLGAVEVPRAEYLERLEGALALALPPAFR